MKNGQQAAHGGPSEYNEQAIQQVEQEIGSMCTPAKQALLDQLIEGGFAWEEAIRLLYLRDHLYENAEMHERVSADPHLQFARWLYEQGEIDELQDA